MKVDLTLYGFSLDIENFVAVVLLDDLLEELDPSTRFFECVGRSLVKIVVLDKLFDEIRHLIDKLRLGFFQSLFTDCNGLVSVVLLVPYVIVDDLRECTDGPNGRFVHVLFFCIIGDLAKKVVINLRAKHVVWYGVEDIFEVSHNIMTVYPCLIFGKDVLRGEKYIVTINVWELVLLWHPTS
ncbi:hypothetical protein ACP93_13575 [Xanthomonas sp. NCPPB 1128]|nr:hypothetical protein ACP93_13575 [Xanthomonas sp. NCPPB 1128]